MLLITMAVTRFPLPCVMGPNEKIHQPSVTRLIEKNE